MFSISHRNFKIIIKNDWYRDHHTNHETQYKELKIAQ